MDDNVQSNFSETNILMIEEQESKEIILQGVTSRLQGIKWKIALLGATAGKEVTFHINETVSSVFAENNADNFKSEILKTQTLDDVVFSAGYDILPDFIKLDVQGSELEVLKGATALIKNVQFILCEVSLIELNRGAPLISDVISFMKERGMYVL